MDASSIAQAVQNYISEGIKPMSMEEVYQQYPPEQIGQMAQPGNLGPVAGIFKSNIANSLIKMLKDKPPNWISPDMERKYIRTLVQQLSGFPKRALENIGDLRFADQPTYNQRGQVQAPGGYFAAPGLKLPFTEGRGLPELKEGLVEVQGPGFVRGAPSMSKDIVHEVGHSLLDMIEKYLGISKASAIRRTGKGPETHGPEEPFASMLPQMSGGEISELLESYGAGELIDKLPYKASLTERDTARVARRLSEKTGRYVVAPEVRQALKSGKRTLQSPEDVAASIHGGIKETKSHTRANFEQIKGLREDLAKQKQGIIDRISRQMEAEKNPKYKENFKKQLESAKAGQSKLVGLMNPLQEEGPLSALYGEKSTPLDSATAEAIKKLFRGEQ